MRFPVLILLASMSLPVLAQVDIPPDVRVSESSPAEESTETAPKKPKVEETIVVTATRSERELSELPVSTTVLREEEIQSTPAVHVDDVLRSIPGIQLPTSNSSTLFVAQSKASMHGLGELSALVLLDGIPLHDPFDGTIQWGKVPTESLRQVEVVRGASASLFGNYALGGAINLRTRPIEDSRMSADASWGTAQTGRGMLMLDHRLGSTLGLRLSHTRHDTDGFLKSTTPGPVDQRAWFDSEVTGFRADWEPAARTSGFFKSTWSEINLSNGSPIPVSNRDILDLAAGAQHTIGNSMLLSGRAFHQRSAEHVILSSVASNRASESRTSDSDVPAAATGASLEWSLQRTGTIPFVSLGVDVQRQEVDEDRTSFSRTGAVTRRNLVEGLQVSSALFGQASWQPNARVEVLTSLRLDHFKNTEGKDTVVGGTVTTYPTKTSTQLDPRVALRWTLGQHTAVRASVYRAFKAPVLRRLYRNSQAGSQIILSNPDLEPETLVGGEVGFEWALPRARFAIDVYRSEVDGFTVRTPLPGQPNVTKYLNLGTIRAQGIETMASAQLAPRWSLDAGYTYADSRIIDDPNPLLIGNQVGNIPLHNGVLGLRYTHERGTAVQLRGRVLSSSFDDSENTEINSAQHVLDLSVSHPLRAWLDAYARLENALDDDYYYASAGRYRPGQPRFLTVGFRMRFPATSTR